MMNMRILVTFAISFLILSSTYSQAGLQVYAGISNANSKDSLLTPEGTSHPGYHIGLDARLNSGNMYFMVGGQYHSIEFLADSDKSYFSVTNKMNWMKFRVGLGYNIYNFSERVALRAKTLGSIDVISSHPGKTLNGPYENYNSGTAGVIVGLGADVHSITIDLEYELGFFNAVNMVSSTSFNFFTMSVGFVF